MSTILEQDYRGITLQLRSEVDFINSIFQHQGLKGEGNESVIRELITRFIPKRYSVGTGILIDSNGQQSRQCDIVIYDNFLYPSILAMSSVHLFPVDIVYATIEVKTTLDAATAQEALQNIASVKSLEIIPDPFGVVDYSVGGVAMTTADPTPPAGCIFAYNSDAKKFETFKAWFNPKTDEASLLYPTLVGCLDQGEIGYPGLLPNPGMKPTALAIPLWVDENSYLVTENYCPSISHNGSLYPVKQVNEEYIAIDQSRVLLSFILNLNELLNYKKINPSIQFSKYYLQESMNKCFEI